MLYFTIVFFFQTPLFCYNPSIHLLHHFLKIFYHSPSPRYRYSDRRRVSNKYRDAERQRQIEERRVIYVGKIAEGSTRADLRRRFEIFGPVIDISLHFRERGY